MRASASARPCDESQVVSLLPVRSAFARLMLPSRSIPVLSSHTPHCGGQAAIDAVSVNASSLRGWTDWLFKPDTALHDNLGRVPSRELYREPVHDSSQLGRLISCNLHPFLRPRPNLRHALMPYLRRVAKAASVVAYQVRAGAHWYVREVPCLFPPATSNRLSIATLIPASSDK